MACLIFTFLVVTSSSLLLTVSDARPIQDTLPPQPAPIKTPTNSLEELSFSTWRIKEEEMERTSSPMENGNGKGEEGPGKPEEGPEIKEEGKKGEENKHRSFDKSKAGGEIILGGLATAVFAVVACYIRVTRRRSHEDEQDPNVQETAAAARAEAPTVKNEEKQEGP